VNPMNPHDHRNKIFLARYIYPVLPLSGMVILLCMILIHIIRQGVSLSTVEKISYLLMILIAVVLIFGGFWVSTQSGIRAVTKILGVPESSMVDRKERRSYRILNLLLVLGAYCTIFLFSVDTKIAVYNLDVARAFNDTPGYIETGSYSLLDRNFWIGDRPFTLPLFYKLVGYHQSNMTDQGEMERVGEIQLILSIISWTLLAFSASITMSKWLLRFLVFGIILMLGASINITYWDRLMLSDSLSNSLFLLFLTLFILSAEIWSKRTRLSVWMQVLVVFCLVISATFYSFVRDPNGLILLAFGGLMALGLLHPVVRKHVLVISYSVVMISFFVVFGIQTATANLNGRYTASLEHVFVYRFFPDDERLGYLLEKGLPYKDQFSSYFMLDLRQLTERLSIDDPDGNFHIWVKSIGKNVLLSYILTNPGYTFLAPFGDLQALTNGYSVWYRKILVPPPIRIKLLSEVFYPRFVYLPFFFLLLSIFSMLLVYKNRPDVLSILTLILFLISVPFLMFVWHSDSNDLERHSLQAAIQLRLASWLCIVLLIERGSLLFAGARERIRLKRAKHV